MANTNSFLITKLKLTSILEKMEKDFSDFVKNPDKDFSRKRNVLFSDTLKFLLSLHGKTLDKELLHFTSSLNKTITSSGMIQARKKLKPSALEHLLYQFNKFTPKGSFYHGYELLAVDGSKFKIPENLQEPLCWIKKPNSDDGQNVLHLNALYRLKSGVFEDVTFQKIHELDEHAALAHMLERRVCENPFILLADRGYEGYNTFAHIENTGGKYLIRGRQGKTGILSALNLPDAEEFDQDISIVLCKKHTKNTRENPQKYKRIRADAKFDFFTEECAEYTMNFRVVKIKISENLTEILFTNLPREKFSSEELKGLYHMRWGIETAFSQLKYALGAMAVHSKNSEFVIQELYAKIVMFNFCKTIMHYIHVPQKEHWKYQYELNITMGMEICREFWRGSASTPEKIEEKLLRYLVPTRVNRSFPRRQAQKSVAHFNNRIS